MDSGDIISLVLGGVIGWFTSWWYHRKASKEGGLTTGQLLASDKKTQRLVNAVGHALANAGFKVTFDQDGNMIPNIELKGEFHGGGALKANLTVTPPKPPPVYDRQHENPSADPEGG